MPPADLQKIERHGQCVLKWPDFALRPVIPVNSNLRIAQPSFASQMKEFNIKGKPVQGQPREKVLGSFRAEALEPTLGIGDAPYREKSHHAVKDATHEMAAKGLLKTPGPRSFPGADGHVEFHKLRWKETLQLLNGHGQVGVTEEAVLSVGREHSGAHGPALALVGERKQRD